MNEDIGDFLRDLETSHKERRTRPRAGEEDVRDENWTAFKMGLQRGASGGWSEKAKARSATVSSDKTYDELKADYFSEAEQYAHQNPVANFLGETTGLIGFGGAATKGISQLGKQVPLLGEALSKGDTVMGRILKAAGIGAAEGGMFNAGQDDSVGTGMLMGLVGGAGGQTLLGELTPGLGRWMGLTKDGRVNSSKIRKKAKDQLRNVLIAKYPHMDDPEIMERMMDALEELGPNATLADADTSLYQAGLSMLSDSKNAMNAGALTDKMLRRARNNPKEFKEGIERLIGNEIPLSPSDVKVKAAQDFKAAKQQLDVVLTKNDGAKEGIRFDPSTLLQSAKDAFNQDVALSPRLRAAMSDSEESVFNKVVKEINKQWDHAANPTIAGIKVKGSKPHARLNGDQLLKIRGVIDDLYDESVNPMSAAIPKARAAELARLREGVNSMLDQIPGFKEANAAYRNTHSVTKAHQMGRDFLTGKAAPDEYDVFLNTAPDWQVESFAMGVKSHLVDQMKKMRGEDKIQKQVALAEEIRGKLSRVFPEELADGIVSSAEDIVRFAAKDKRMEAKLDKAVFLPPQGDITSAFDVLTAGGSLANLVSSAAGLGAGRRLSSKMQGTGHRVDKDMLQMLSKEGPEAVMQLFERNPNPIDPSISDYLGLPFMAGSVASQE